MSSFNDFNLSKPLLTALTELGYESPTPVQQQVIPHFLNDEDVLAQAQTGTGKTAAFALPILSKINLKNAAPQALILTPTRELSLQVAEAFQSYAKHLKDFHVLPIYGGQNFQQQLRALKRGAHVIVGTPGRMIDMLERGKIDTSNFHTLVLDEADEMLKMGFIDDVDWILSQLKSVQQTALFSATLPPAIKKISQRYLKNPKVIEVKSKVSTEVKIEQCYIMATKQHKLDALTRTLEAENTDGVIIFTRTKNSSTELTEKLSARGFAASALNGDMNQSNREQVIKQMKNQSIDIIVATDVAARGIDIDRISHVINFDVPHDTESYIHRIGRTGRAGRSGKAILFIAPNERRILNAIERVTNQRISELPIPSHQQITKKRQQKFTDKVKAILTNNKIDLSSYEESISALCHDEEHEPLTVAAALAYMLNKPLPAESKDDMDAPTRKSKKPFDKHFGEIEKGMVRCKIDMGRRHQIKPGQIVGLIANKANISSELIGNITLFDDYTTVDLDAQIADAVLKSLGKVKLRGGVFHLRRC